MTAANAMQTEDQHLELTEFDLGVLRSTGFPLATSQLVATPSREQVYDAVTRVLHAPSARTTEAAVCALLYLAQQEMEPLPQRPLNEVMRRRLGFLLDEMKTWKDLPATTTRRLEVWLRALSPPSEPATWTPVALSDRMSPLRLKRMAQTPTPTQARWGVYGHVELRPEVLARFSHG